MTHQDAVSELVARIYPHHPNLATAIFIHAQAVREGDPERFTSYNRRDSSEDVCVGLIEAMLALQQLRLELLAQFHAIEDPPLTYTLCLQHLISMEVNLAVAAGLALDVHKSLWAMTHPASGARSPA